VTAPTRVNPEASMTNAAARPATMLDVARLAGVSHQTVSRYLRFAGGLKPATSERISTAIAELDYRPNLVARSMRTRRTGRLAVVLPGPHSFGPGPVLAGAVGAADGYVVEALSVAGGAEERAERVRELASSGQVEGILSLAPVADVGDLRGVAFVVSADFDDDTRSIGHRASGTGVTELVEGLAVRGHRRLLHVTGDLDFASARARRDVFLETTARLGLEGQVVDGDWSAQSGASAVARLAPGAVTAIVAANDVQAGGAVQAARARGWEVPRVLSVTGWDDHPLGALLSPTLTTVRIDSARLGADAMHRLVAAVRGEQAPAPVTDALHEVIWRDSVGDAPTQAPETP